jgi:hypothetical protein
VHEAGHALAYTKLGVGIEYATIERKKVSHNGHEMVSSGFTQPCPRELTRATIEREAICTMAGPAAEDSFNGRAQSGSQGDVDSLGRAPCTLACQRKKPSNLSAEPTKPPAS